VKKIVFFILALVFLFSSLNLTDSIVGTYGIYIVYIFLSGLLILPIFTVKKEIKINIPTVEIMYLFFMFCLISSMVNADFKTIISSFMILNLFIVSCIILPRLNLEINKILVYSVLISHIPIVLFPLIINGFDTMPYKGIFYNPNSFGSILATIFVILLAAILGNLENIIKGASKKLDRLSILFLGAMLIYTLYLISLSSSRTSFLSAIISLFVGIAFLMWHLIKEKKIVSLLKRGVIFIVGSTIFYILINKFTALDKALYSSIFYKFEMSTHQDGGVLSGRGNIWVEAISNAGFFGKGKGFFSEIGYGAHNTFISIIGNYGWIPLILFFLFLIILFYYCVSYAISNTSDIYKYLPLLMCISFLTMSMGEEMIFKLNMLVMFFSFGSIFQRKWMLNRNLYILNTKGNKAGDYYHA